MSAPHTTGAVGTLATLARLTLGVRATFAILGRAILFLRMFWKGVTLILGRPGLGGLSGR